MTQITTIIRQRGQITIPDAIRKVRSWANQDSVVVISSDNPDEIIIRPQKNTDWDKIMKLVKKARRIKGKNTSDSTQFIMKDRLSH